MVVLHRLKRFYHGIHATSSFMRSGKSKERFFREARGSRILVYHGVCKSDPYRFNHLFITAEKFEAHLKLFKEYCHCLTLDEYYAGKFSSEQFNICLSFDDGFANNYEYVLPLLKQYEIPAAFFITSIRKAGYGILWNDFLSIFQRTGPDKLSFRNKQYIKNQQQQYVCISSRRLLREELRQEDFESKDQLIKAFCNYVHWNKERTYWLQLSEEQIKKLSASPWVTIGSHGYYHNDLNALSPGRAKEEMKNSRLYLQDLTQKEVKALAFPYGSYSPGLIKEAIKLGYHQLLAVDYLHESDNQLPLLKSRMTINPFLNPDQQLVATIKGNYDC